MKNRFFNLSVLGTNLSVLGTSAAALIIGCAYFSKNASVQSAISPDGKPDTAGQVAVPFFIIEKYRGGQGDKSWPDSAITDRFVTGLVKHGYKVIDRTQVRKVLKENEMSPADLFGDDNIQKIGALLGADTMVLGKLTLVELEDGKTLERKLNVRGIAVADGAVVFSVSSIDTTPYKVLSAENLADQAIADMFPPPEKKKRRKRSDDESGAELEFSASAEAESEASAGTDLEEGELAEEGAVDTDYAPKEMTENEYYEEPAGDTESVEAVEEAEPTK